MFELLRRSPGQIDRPEVENGLVEPIPQILDEIFCELNDAFTQEGPSLRYQELQSSSAQRILSAIQQRIDNFSNISFERSIDEKREINGEHLHLAFSVNQSEHGSDPDRLAARTKLEILNSDGKVTFKARSSQLHRPLGDRTFYIDNFEGPTLDFNSDEREYAVVFRSYGKDDLRISVISRKTRKVAEGNHRIEAKKEAVGYAYDEHLT